MKKKLNQRIIMLNKQKQINNFNLKFKAAGLIMLLALFSSCFNKSKPQGVEKSDAEELRAPAYPLVIHNPYQSIWSMGDELNGSPTKHWTGQNHALVGMAKIDGQVYRFLGGELKNYQKLLPTTDQDGYSVQYVEKKPSQDWASIGFNDASWKRGEAPFSDNASQAKTLWDTDDLWVRRTFDLEDTNLSSLYLKLRHDDNIKVYLNGRKIYDFEGWEDQYKYIPVDEAIIQNLKKEGNVLAIHIRNTGGGRWLDAGLVTDAPQMDDVEIKKAKQTSVRFNATQTIYTFDCGNTQLTATFTSPLLLDNLKVFSRPVSYLSVKVKSKDSQDHNVQLYLGVSSSLAVNSPAQEVEAWNYNKNGLDILKTGTTEQPILQKKGDDLRIDWGYSYVAASASTATHQYISSLNEAVLPFVTNKEEQVDKEVKGKKLMLNTIANLGKVGSKEKEQVFMLGYDELYSINYFGHELKPWWTKNYNSFEEVLEAASSDYQGLIEKCEIFDKQLSNDAKKAGGEKYADLCILAYRQSIAAHNLVEAPNGDLLFLSKENHSNGSINTVDLTYPSAPLFLIYNPDLMKGMLNGIFYYSESGKWKKPFPAHDLGTYPIATGQTYGEDMPIEEAGNAIIVTAAIAVQEGNANYAKKHWETLTTWANYLMKNGFDPANQLSTDDFAGHLARNANLSVKAIEAIAAYGKLAGMLGDKEIEEEFTDSANKMAKKWMELAENGDHYTLAFEKPGTWSQKYNLAWDTILDLNIFPKSVRKTEINYYLTQQNEYGLPLDSRENYTKSDWVLWTATLADNNQDFEALINPIWKYANETGDRVPVSDWHDTNDAHVMNFKARSVVGGYFMKLLKWKNEKKK